MRRLLAAVAIVTLLFGAPGCTAGRVISGQGIPSTVSTEGRLAIQGRAVVAACDGILTATDAAVTAKALTPQLALPVAQACRQVGLMGQQLATALRTLDTNALATGAPVALADALALLTQMSDAVSALPQATRSLVTDSVGAFFGALTTLRGMLPQQ